MNMETLFESKPGTRAGITPRDYQIADHDENFRFWDSGVKGTLTRAFTGAGKTLMSCLKADTWLRRGDDYRVMIISYETQLVDQWKQEIEDYLGITPGVEMESEKIDPARIPSITVACRASLLRHTKPDQKQIQKLESFGVVHLGAVTKGKAKQYLKFLSKGGDAEDVKDDIIDFNNQPEVSGEWWSRVHKFDWKLNWLVFWDEAHRHAHKLTSVGHIVDWFFQNPASRQNGLTATPKRSDMVSLGEKMFPGIAIDFPLYSPSKPCAVKEGWAVSYVQKYIEVEGVDFKNLAKMKGEDFDQEELERKLNEEGRLAKLVEPLLGMVGDRKTLIFSPGVQMAKDVANYINARAETFCPTCQKKKWYPSALIGDGAACKCGRMVLPSDVTKKGVQAYELDGCSCFDDRKEVYSSHKQGKFQFLSVCGLCREGYNDPDISCVAVFRPVSKKASSLAEQMKGRGCRPLKGVVDKCRTRDERIAAIAASPKPNCLVVDLVGITGLGDCASSVQIYADGLPDEVKLRAEEILAAGALTEEMDVEDAIEKAEEEDRQAKERAKIERLEAERRAREEAEQRSKAHAEAKWTEHEIGHAAYDPTEASVGQYKFMSYLGMKIEDHLTKRQAGRIIGMLKSRRPWDEIARLNRLKEWSRSEPSFNQDRLLKSRGVHDVETPFDASRIISAIREPIRFETDVCDDISKARDNSQLTAIWFYLSRARRFLPVGMEMRLIAIAKQRRSELLPDEPIPD